MMSHFYKVLFKKIVIIKKERYTLMQTGRTRYSENRSIAVFSCINFELILIKQVTLNKQGSTHKIAFCK